MQNYRYAVEQFGAIPLTGKAKPLVGITGEIYMKYSKLGNDNIESFILEHGGAAYSGGFLNYCIYLVDSEKYKAEKYLENRALSKGYDFALNYLCGLQKQLFTAIGEDGRFFSDMPFAELKEKTEGIIDYGCNTGDGWLIAGEVVQYVERGSENVLILHPFGCLVSHVCERGIMKKLHEKYPEINIQTIEYDYDQSRALRESRILLALSRSGS